MDHVANLYFTLPTERNDLVWFIYLVTEEGTNIGTYQVGGFVVSAHPIILLRGIMGRGVDEMGQPKAPNINGLYFYANGMQMG